MIAMGLLRAVELDEEVPDRPLDGDDGYFRKLRADELLEVTPENIGALARTGKHLVRAASHALNHRTGRQV